MNAKVTRQRNSVAHSLKSLPLYFCSFLGIFVGSLIVSCAIFYMYTSVNVNLLPDDISPPIVLPSRGMSYFSPFAKEITLIGRKVSFSKEKYISYDWPCVQIQFQVKNTQTVMVMLNGGNSNHYLVEVDGQKGLRFTTDRKTNTENQLLWFKIAENLNANRTYSLNIFKITEGGMVFPVQIFTPTPTRFAGISIDASGKLLPKLTKFTRRIEFFGDSDSNGFGIEGSSFDVIGCMKFHKYQNCYESYAAVLSRSLHADMHIEAFSGRGVVENAFNLDNNRPMPFFWNCTLTRDCVIDSVDNQNIWRFSDWIPHAVVVYLGSNDFMPSKSSNIQEFKKRLKALLQRILDSYKSADSLQIILICGGNEKNQYEPCPTVQNASHSFKQFAHNKTSYIEIPKNLTKTSGCLGHRNILEQRKVAKFLLPKFRKLLNW